MALLLMTGIHSPCRACVALSTDSKGQARPVSLFISGEQAVIIWDEIHKTEHFIRQADIVTSESNVGFVVPTPQTPELVAVDPIIFNEIGDEAAPQIIPTTQSRTPMDVLANLGGLFSVKVVFTTITSQLAIAASGPSTNSISDHVQVISEQDVAGYHATVLGADDTASLSRWLKENGYAWNEKDDAWLQPYLAAKWKITAFKLFQSPGLQNVGVIQSRAIRMSFKTDHPFFPYSEPGDTQSGNKPNPGERILSVAILSDQRMSGKLADDNAWPGELHYSGPMETPYSGAQFMALAKLENAKEPVTLPTHLTYFVDRSNPRPGTADLNFSSAADQTNFRKVIEDPNLPPNWRMDWSHPVANAEALLTLLAIAASLIFVAKLILRVESST